MSGRKKSHQNGVDPGTTKEVEPDSAKREPTFAEWQILLDRNIDEELEIQLTIAHLMFSTSSGRAYLEYVTRYRPDLEKYPLDFMQLVSTYEALPWLDQLLVEPRLGTDPTYFIWHDIWNDPSLGPDFKYLDLLRICQGMERRATDDQESARLRAVREAIEREFIGEEYIQRKRAFTRGTT